ncbi:MAG: serine protease [Candidatus Tectomicrobia bacterium]|nr:serine protease [Candidatus Tectomicrobia bacterium]
MPTWSEILNELQKNHKGDGSEFDLVRRRYLVSAKEHSQRNTILYATKWTQPDPHIDPDVISIAEEDLQGFMEVLHGLSGTQLDLILHSPGGSPTVAEAIVSYLRSKFDHIKVIVPSLAMSAATMIACAADIIVMGKHSFLGPIDPQLLLPTPLGLRMVPAQAILDQFDKALSGATDQSSLAAWYPMLGQYGPDLLLQCERAIELSKELVKRWLTSYMFRNVPEERYTTKPAEIAQWLSSHGHWKTHSRHIPRSELEQQGLKIEHLEQDQVMQDIFLSIFHATTHTFQGTNAVKIIENHEGKAFIKLARIMVQQHGPRTGGSKSKSKGKKRHR